MGEDEGDGAILHYDHISCRSSTGGSWMSASTIKTITRRTGESDCVISAISAMLGSGTAAGKVLPTNKREEIRSWMLFDSELIRED